MYPSTRGPKTIRLAALSVALALLLTAGCSSRKPIDATSPESIIQAVNRGDTVRVTTRNGTEHQFVIDRITNKALYGQGKRVIYEDMQEVQIRRGGRTVKSSTTASGEKDGGFFESVGKSISSAWEKIF